MTDTTDVVEAEGTPGVVALCSTAHAAELTAERVAAIGPTSLMVHHGVDGPLSLVRAAGPVDALVDAMAPGADVGLHQTASRHLLTHRRTWDLGSPTPGVSMIYLTRAKPGLSAADYHRYWQREHGPRALRHHLGMWDYTQVSVTRTLRGEPIDGVAVTQWPCPEDLADRFTDGPVGTAVIQHDAAQFTHLSALERHRMDERVLVEAALPADGTVEITDARCHEFGCSADALWAVLGRFDALLEWWPAGFTACSAPSAHGPGMTRILTRQNGSRVVERLLDHRPDERMFHLVIDEGMPPGVEHYTCRYEVRPLGADRCRLDWNPRASARVDAVPLFEAVVDRGWPMVVAGLSSAV